MSPSGQQFVSEDSKRPKVGGKVVALVEQNLRSNILWCTTKRPGLVSKANVFGKPKVNLHNSVAYKLNVLIVTRETEYSVNRGRRINNKFCTQLYSLTMYEDR